MMLVGDTGFEPVTSSVSVISDTPDNAAAGVSFLVWCSATATVDEPWQGEVVRDWRDGPGR